MPIACFKADLPTVAVLQNMRCCWMSLDAPALSRSCGINAVLAVVINDRYLISGDQSPGAYERALRNIAAELAPVA